MTTFQGFDRPAQGANGFTLIELLIVIAIIAILAAIAIPNFLEAQIRGKVARSQSDLRTLGTAVEVYFVDYNSYPLSADERGWSIIPYPPVGLGPEAFETRLSGGLTTPVAYLSVLPKDPFAAKGPDSEDPRIFEGPGYHYGSVRYAEANDGSEGVEKYGEFVRMMGGNAPAVRYFLSSHGPDLDHDDDEELSDIHAAVPYDPTNGTLSSGDIVLFGPGGGFGS